MQYRVYRNNGNSGAYPYLMDVQSDIIDDLHTRMVIPLFPLKKLNGRPVQRLNPVLVVDGAEYVMMTHEMASVRRSHLGEGVMDAQAHRKTIKDAIDFLFDGF